MCKLEGKVAIITGGTSGIGEATANLFAEQKAIVIIVGRNEEKGLLIEEYIKSKNGKAKFFKCDVSNELEVKALIDNVIKLYGKIDILFNNAGIFLPSIEIEKLDFDKWKETFDINIHGTFLITKYVKEHLIESKGVILNNASIAGLQYYAAGRSYAYSSSKAAIIQFSHMMAKNYAEDGIRVNCICPGVILTPILHGRDPKIYAERIPMKRVGNPEEVAKVALFLCSDDASYLTGVVLPVDGGASL